MDNESIMDIKQQLADFKELEDVRHIDVYIDNGSLVSCNTDMELKETGLLYSFTMEDGCSFKYYVPYDKIAYVSVVYDCPKRLSDLGE